MWEPGSAGNGAHRALDIIGVEKSFDAFHAVRNVSLSVEPGEFLALLGPSGSGKTSLLRMVAGLEYADSGRIEIGGRDVARVPPFARNIGMVFQKYALFPHMNITDNIAFPLRRRGVSRRQARAEAAEALALVGLAELGHRHPRELSGGQQQRVALARAIVFHPDILLMDEPLGALDKQLRERMQREIRSLQRRIGITTLYVTHDQNEALTIADRVAVMNAGRIEDVAAPRLLYDRPATVFVSRFLGDSNLIPIADGSPGTQGAHLTLAGGIKALCHATAPPAAGSSFLIVRPEKLLVRPAAPAADVGTNSVRGLIRQVVYAGDISSYDIDCGTISLSAKQLNSTAHPVLADGTPVTVSWAADDCWVVAE